jgi:hypothetical protein
MIEFFPPFLMNFGVSAGELIQRSNVAISTMQPLIVVEGDVRLNDSFSMSLTE